MKTLEEKAKEAFVILGDKYFNLLKETNPRGDFKHFIKMAVEYGFRHGYNAAQEWISVDDELPEQITHTLEDEVNGNTLYFYEHYIVKGYYKNQAKTESTWIGVYKPYSIGWYFQVIKPQNTVDFVITHWKPINND